jgi:hypothetical protein
MEGAQQSKWSENGRSSGEGNTYSLFSSGGFRVEIA